jgi:predicted nucleic acid-binding protein
VLYAAADTDDEHHEACVALLEERVGELIVPLPVVVEVCYLVQTRLGAPAEGRFLASLARGDAAVDNLTPSDLDRILELVNAYLDLPLGMVDASVVAVAERLRLEVIATLDRRDFLVVRPRHIAAFCLLP